MLEENIRQIFHTMLKEKEVLGVMYSQREDQLHVEREDELQSNGRSRSGSVDSDSRELRNPEWSHEKSNGYQTPPYLSPGVTKRVVVGVFS